MQVSFVGVTGTVEFYDASADPDLKYNGDRRTGVAYDVWNYQQKTGNGKLVLVGRWVPGGAAWVDRWADSTTDGATFSTYVYSTSDNSQPAVSTRVSLVRLGVLLPMFGTASSEYTLLDKSARAGAIQALHELNNKTDGVMDHLLPHTQIRFAYYDSKCDSTEGLAGALYLTTRAFEHGISAIIGAQCSSASISASEVAGLSSIPIVSPASTSPTLSDGKRYPYFLRVTPSDSYVTTALVNVLRYLLEYTSVTLVYASDAFSSGLGLTFIEASSEGGLAISVVIRFAENTVDFQEVHHSLRETSSRVIVLFSQGQDGSNLIRTALDAGIGGDGYMWLGASAGFASASAWRGEPAMRERAFKGFLALEATNGEGSPAYSAYLTRRRRLGLTIVGDQCKLDTDDTDDAHYLWAQDDDDNASTPLRCSRDSPTRDTFRDAFGYDAVYAIAYALHDLVEVQTRTEVVGSELLDTLIKSVRFEGVTGLIDFYDASGDPDLRYHGDRRVGFSYTLLNFVDESQGLATVGMWSPCAVEPCPWSVQYRSMKNLTFSTADNSRPPQEAHQKISEVLMGMLLPMFNTEAAGYTTIAWSPRAGVVQALREINNKTDGLADDLLPDVKLKIAYRDSKCDASVALQAMLSLTQDAFDGKGVSAVIGAGCSGASISAAQVAQKALVPLISPSSLSPTLSNGMAYPFFLRTIPSDEFRTDCMVSVLQNLMRYSTVALVTSTDNYGVGAARAFSRAAFSVGLTISTLLSIEKDAPDFSQEHRLLLQVHARVVVLVAQGFDAANFVRTGLEAGVGGPGFLWMFGNSDHLDESLWVGLAPLRVQALKGSFHVETSTREGTPVYDAYLARRRQLSPVGNARNDCSHTKDDEDAAYLWAQDHDNNISTPLACARPDFQIDNLYDAFAYDAVFAVAYALHDLVNTQNRTKLIGSELLDTLIKRVRFEGVTGLIEFTDASASPDREFLGDRRVGISYSLHNFVDNERSRIEVGRWSICKRFSCSWADQWHPAPGVVPQFSTPDNHQPSNCPPGRVLMQDGTCGCRSGYFASSETRGVCETCPKGVSSLPGSVGAAACSFCDEGFYSRAHGEPCVQCLTGGECPLNSTLSTILLRKGFWRLSPYSTVIEACTGDNDTSPCVGGRNKGTCAAGFLGHRCGSCSNSSLYYNDGVCKVCPSTAERFLVVTFIAAGAGIVLRVLWILFKRPPSQLEPLSQLMRHTADVSSQIGLGLKFRIAIAFYQCVSAATSVYLLGIPQGYYHELVRLFNWVNIEWPDAMMPSSCLGSFRFRMWLTAIGPLVGITVSLLVQMSASRGRVRQILLRSIEPCLLVVYLLAPSVSRAVFKAWDCAPSLTRCVNGSCS